MSEPKYPETEILVDRAESRCGIERLLLRFSHVRTRSVELSAGDYVVAPGVGVERKAGSDFVASILDRRLFGQIEKLKAEYEFPLILIEGDPLGSVSAIDPYAVLGAISYVATIAKIQLVFSKNVEQSASLLELMARHTQHGLGYVPPLRGQRPKDLSSLAQFVIEGLPGVGPSSAQTLLGAFGSVQKVMTASVDELCTVKGIGKKTALGIREVADFECAGYR